MGLTKPRVFDELPSSSQALKGKLPLSSISSVFQLYIRHSTSTLPLHIDFDLLFSSTIFLSPSSHLSQILQPQNGTYQ